MIFFLAFPFLALALAMLFVAAITFATTATIPAFRRSAITAPITAFCVAPAILLAQAPWIYNGMFITDPPVNSAGFWIRFGTVLTLVTAACLFVAWIANLGCRAVFQIVPSWLSRSFRIRDNLLLQASILTGGSLSTLVLLVTASLLVYIAKDNLIAVVLSGFGGLLTSALCILALRRLPDPQCYQPKPIPKWANRLLNQRA